MSKVHIGGLEYTYQIGKMYTVIKCAETNKKIVAKNLEIATTVSKRGTYPIMPRHVRYYLGKMLGATEEINPYKVGDLLYCCQYDKDCHFLIIKNDGNDISFLDMTLNRIDSVPVCEISAHYPGIKLLSR